MTGCFRIQEWLNSDWVTWFLFLSILSWWALKSYLASLGLRVLYFLTKCIIYTRVRVVLCTDSKLVEYMWYLPPRFEVEQFQNLLKPTFLLPFTFPSSLYPIAKLIWILINESLLSFASYHLCLFYNVLFSFTCFEFTYMCVICDALFSLSVMFLRFTHVEAHRCVD